MNTIHAITDNAIIDGVGSDGNSQHFTLQTPKNRPIIGRSFGWHPNIASVEDCRMNFSENQHNTESRPSCRGFVESRSHFKRKGRRRVPAWVEQKTFETWNRKDSRLVDHFIIWAESVPEGP